MYVLYTVVSVSTPFFSLRLFCIFLFLFVSSCPISRRFVFAFLFWLPTYTSSISTFLDNHTQLHIHYIHARHTRIYRRINMHRPRGDSFWLTIVIIAVVFSFLSLLSVLLFLLYFSLKIYISYLFSIDALCIHMYTCISCVCVCVCMCFLLGGGLVRMIVGFVRHVFLFLFTPPHPQNLSSLFRMYHPIHSVPTPRCSQSSSSNAIHLFVIFSFCFSVCLSYF